MNGKMLASRETADIRNVEANGYMIALVETY